MIKAAQKLIVGSMVISSILAWGTPIKSLATDNINNSPETANRFTVESSYSKSEQHEVTLNVSLNSVEEEEWFVVKLPAERGSLFYLYGQYSLPEISMFSKNASGQLEPVSNWDSVAGKDVYVRLNPTHSGHLGQYPIRFVYGANPISTNDSFEPNDRFINWSEGRGAIESALIPNDTLVSTKWNTDYDGTDNFRIETNSNKGTLTFEVHYSALEYDFWKTYNKDYYLTYELYAQEKDGHYRSVWSKAQIGIPNQVFAQTINIDNPNYTGKYVLSLRNGSLRDKNYQVSMNFKAVVEEPTPTPEPVPNPTPTPTPNPTEPEQPTNPTPAPTPEQITERLSGDTRFGTNLAITGKIADHTLDSVILANAWNYPDALSGGVLNNSHNGAILLVENTPSTINSTLQEAKRLLKTGGKVFILGGTSAVHANVETAFRTHFSVERIGGVDRIETAINLAKKATTAPNEVFITFGYNYADSLSIVPYASKVKAPILLNPTNALDSRVKAYIQEKGIQKVTIIGGNAAISSQVENSLKAMKLSVTRVSGDTRYSTALAIAKKYYPNSNSVGIASGQSFADALSGSRMALDKDMPIVLVQKNGMESAVNQYVTSKDNHYIFGGTAVIGTNVTDQLK